ncbi:MAG TPA: hypothetical protein VEW11_00240 [Gaiellaceae bacterium]|nr:hypothetical protein [Gaiellaceae bacterium]
MRRVTAIACLALGLLAGPANAAVGELRVLVVPLTWGPPVPAEQELRAALADAHAFYARASFGRASIGGTITPVVTGYIVPPSCFAGADEDAGLGAVARSARAAAARLGYDLAAYDRFVYVFPDRVCGSGGLGSGRDVLLAGDIGGLVHELGHTFRLPHASSARCASCTIREYGDPDSVMGQGGPDFNAWEKAQLGWLNAARRVSASGTYAVGPVDRDSDGAQALIVRTRAGTLWVEHRLSPSPRVSIRVVKRPRGGGAVRSVYLAGGRVTATAKGLVRVRRVAEGLALTRLDRQR